MAADHPTRVGALLLTPCDAFQHFFPPTFRYLQLLARLPFGVWLAAQSMRIPGAARLPPAFGRVQARSAGPERYQRWLAPTRQDAAVRRDTTRLLRAVDARDTHQVALRLRDFSAPIRLLWADTKRVFPLSDAFRMAASWPTATPPDVVSGALAHLAVDAPERVAGAVLSLTQELAAASPRP